MQGLSPFRLMYTMFAGFSVSLLYGVFSFVFLYFVIDVGEANAFLNAYTGSFNTLISLGLILGAALIVGRTQDVIPEAIEKAFTPKQLEKTDYALFRGKFYDRQRSVIWSSELGIACFMIFLLVKFPLNFIAENLMILAVCAEYMFGVYVGRKLFYSGLMLHALLKIRVTRNLFRRHELDIINAYTNICSTLTIIFGYIHLRNYYYGPFSYQGFLGESAKIFILLPAIIGTPVLLIFNFYPRLVLRDLYSRSIDVETRNLKRRLKNQSLTSFERLSLMIEFDRQSREELRYRSRLTLSDLPIGITILIMILGPFLER